MLANTLSMSNFLNPSRRFLVLAILTVFLLLLLTVIRASLFSTTIAPEKHIYFEIVFLLLLAVIGELAVSYTKQPSVMILLILGMLLSPSFVTIAWDFLLSFHFPLFFSLPATPPVIFLS